MAKKLNKKIRFSTAKYLLSAASLLPFTGLAKGRPGYSLPHSTTICSNQMFDLSLHAGMSYLLPSSINNNNLGKSEMIGFNGGAFIDVGSAFWARLNHSECELHMEPFGRLEVHSINTCVYSVGNNIHASGQTKQNLIETYPYERVQDVIATANLNIGIGYNGFTFETVAGLGLHVDTKQQCGFVFDVGAGLGARINDHIKLRAGYRMNTNVVLQNGPVEGTIFRHSIEAGFIYVFNRGYYNKVYNNRYYSHAYRQRRGRHL